MVRCPQDYKNVTNNYSMTSEVNVATETNSVFITPYVFSPTAYVSPSAINLSGSSKRGMGLFLSVLIFHLKIGPPTANVNIVLWPSINKSVIVALLSHP